MWSKIYVLTSFSLEGRPYYLILGTLNATLFDTGIYSIYAIDHSANYIFV